MREEKERGGRREERGRVRGERYKGEIREREGVRGQLGRGGSV